MNNKGLQHGATYLIGNMILLFYLNFVVYLPYRKIFQIKIFKIDVKKLGAD
jgi:hypothetical protein